MEPLAFGAHHLDVTQRVVMFVRGGRGLGDHGPQFLVGEVRFDVRQLLVEDPQFVAYFAHVQHGSTQGSLQQSLPDAERK